MPLIVPLISCFYANQTFLGLDGLVNNTPGRPICHRQASSWRQLLPHRLVSPSPRPRPGPAHSLAGLLPTWPHSPGSSWHCPLAPSHRAGD